MCSMMCCLFTMAWQQACCAPCTHCVHTVRGQQAGYMPRLAAPSRAAAATCLLLQIDYVPSQRLLLHRDAVKCCKAAPCWQRVAMPCWAGLDSVAYAYLATHPWPGALVECLACCLDCNVNIPSIRIRHLFDDVSCPGVNHIQLASSLGAYPLVVDEQLQQQKSKQPKHQVTGDAFAGRCAYMHSLPGSSDADYLKVGRS